MKLIIDIPEEVKVTFDNATKDDIYGSYYDYNSVIGNAIKNGTPLPKGHGDLIDRDEFHQTLENIPIRLNDKWFNWLQKACNRLAEAPTIIEADKGEKNDRRRENNKT